MTPTLLPTGAARPRRAGLAALILAAGIGAAAAQDAGQPGAAQQTITAHGISTFGELKYPADFTHLDYVNPDAPKGGEISEWASGGFDSMNPYSVKGRAAGLSSALYEPILVGTDDEIGAAYCLICSTLEYPPDRAWVIFNLRPEAAFSDGSPLTSDDVIFSYETFLAKGLTDFRTIFATKVEKVEALDAHRVKFTFKTGIPTRDLVQDVGGLPVLSRADYEKNDRDLEASDLRPFLGSGPYVLDRMETGQTIVYRRNPDYWGRDLPIMRGQNNFDRIRIEYYADYNAAFEGFKGGNYTFRNEASSILWATGYDFPGVRNGSIVKVELPSGAKANGQGFLFNLRRAKFQDPRVREAIGLMFNFEWSNATLFYGLYARIDSLWENSWLGGHGRARRGRAGDPAAARGRRHAARLDPDRSGGDGARLGQAPARPRPTCAAPPRCWTRRAGRSAPPASGAMRRARCCASSSSTTARPSTASSTPTSRT